MSLDSYKEGPICTRDTLKATLEEHGFAVIENVLSEEECGRMLQGQHEALEKLTSKMDKPFKHTDPTTYSTLPLAGPLHGMIYQSSGLGQAPYAWEVRSHPGVVANFEAIWNESDLRVSVDAIAAHYPQPGSKNGTNKGNDWFHLDQHPIKKGLHTIQSWVTATPVVKGSATLTVLSGGHARHEELYNTFKAEFEKGGIDWVKLSPEHLKFYADRGCKIVSVMCKAGSQVFFDSRLPHQGTLPHPNRDRPELIRSIVYVCMAPREHGEYEYKKGIKKHIGAKRAIEKDKQRVSAIQKGLAGSHNPNDFRLFSKNPRFYGLPPALVNVVTEENSASLISGLTPRARQLAGFLE